MARLARRALPWLVLVSFALGASEALLRLAAWAFAPAGLQSVALSLPDERLRVRPNPEFPGHDRRGFRNPTALDRADIVVLGDSQTYGVGVPSEKAWPMQLQALTGHSVYSMAFGGWGPLESEALLEQALALHPAVVIEAIYSGNDLYDAFIAVYGGRQRADLAATDAGVAAAVAEAERCEPLGAKAGGIFAQLYQPSAPPGGEWSQRLADVSLVWRTLEQF